MKTILVVDDNRPMRDGILLALQVQGRSAEGVGSAEEAVEICRRREVDLILMDYRLPGMNGVEGIREVKRVSPETDVLMITAFGSIELAVEAVREGAADFLPKPFTPEELRVKLELIARQRTSRQLVEAYATGLDQAYPDELVTQDPRMIALLRKMEKVAATDATIFIAGESGTGKELLARASQRRSGRAAMPLICVNCGALSEGILESELFGHERGAFTNALRQKKGRLELAHGGTLFLDEVGDISPALQVKLLRAVQEGEFERVGGERTLHADIRWICATHRDIPAMVRTGAFREDLFYRLHVVPIEVPPLRERPGDIPLLTDHFVRRLAAERHHAPIEFPADTRKALEAYPWPGNVRELRNLVEMLSILHPGQSIAADLLPPKVLRSAAAETPAIPPFGPLEPALDALERQMIQRALDATGGTLAQAAGLLGIKPNTLHYKMKRHGLR